MKTNFILLSIMMSVGALAQRADIIVQYEDAAVTLTTIGNTGDLVVNPQDLEFHPDLSKNELWVLSKGTISSGSHTTTFFNTGEASQTSIAKADENNWHFMNLSTGLAFSEDNYNWANSPGVYDANHDGGNPFTGPALWSSDLAVYAEPSGGNGSHLDMLHQSPYCQGIAWETENVFWVYDGNLNDIVRYDFADDHGPGNSWHDDGEVTRYGGLDLVRDPDEEVVSHMVIDHATGWLYSVDFGNQRVIRLDINTGTLGSTPSFGPFEPLAVYKNVDGFTWEEVITTGLDEPAGIALINNKLLVSDHATGDIIVYQTSGAYAFEEWFRIETGDPGILGIEIGPDGRIFYVNEFNNKVRRIDAPTLKLDDVERTAISLYPNPANDVVRMSWNNQNLPTEVKILDMTGKEIYLQQAVSTIEVDVSAFAKGVYVVQIDLSNGEQLTEKLIVE